MSNEDAINTQNPALMVPRLLYSPNRSQSHRRWNTVAKRAAKTGSWEVALTGVEFMPMDQIQGDIAVNNAHALLFSGENLWLDDMHESLFHACWDRYGGKDRDASQALLDILTESGLDHFWFALSVCVGICGGLWQTPKVKQGRAKVMLPKLLRWWPMICQYDQRFSHGQKAGYLRGWPLWSSGLAGLCNDLGKDYSEVVKGFRVSPFEAAKIATKWLEAASSNG